MDAADREFVRQRASQRCEDCRLPQSATPFFTFHVEHIRAKQHRGSDERQNLALACPDCNAFKGPNLTAIDPVTDEVASLFNPRLHEWNEHFAFLKSSTVGLTPIGRATVALLNMNEEARLELRSELMARGEL